MWQPGRDPLFYVRLVGEARPVRFHTGSASHPCSGVFVMSYRCEVCGKEPSFGKNVTFSHKRNSRRWLPNIQKVRVKHGSNTRRARVCTSCIRAGKIEKA
jgi:large subunit ribosomal protein L28